jgi:hypothetical protein
VPEVSPAEAGRQALAEYDTNNDGFLDAAELERCPALKGALKELDTDNDGRLSADEIAARLTAFQATQTGLVAIPCRVTLNDKPLAGATVTLVPEKFMGPAFMPATGVSDAKGAVLLRVEGQELPGIPWGYYRIEVSRKNAAGAETLPARYNVRSVLGQEVKPDSRSLPLRLSGG